MIQVVNILQVDALHGEFVQSLTKDGPRMDAVLFHTAKHGHPVRKFTWGNKNSLWTTPRLNGVSIRDAVLQHWRAFYTPKHMSLVVHGHQSLDALENMVRSQFERVRAYSVAADTSFPMVSHS